MADAAKWYVVHTYSGYENKTRQLVRQRDASQADAEGKELGDKINRLPDGSCRCAYWEAKAK